MILALLIVLLAMSIDSLPQPAATDPNRMVPSQIPAQLIVRRGDSIAAALARATAGAEVMVEPGEYREAVTLPSNVRLVSRVPGGAVIRLPAAAGESDAALVARGVSGAAVVGFRIIGDATTALGTGLFVEDADLAIIDTEISGATHAAIDIIGASRVELMASSVHDNPGVALSVRSGASARVVHNVFARNAGSPATPAPIILDETGDLMFNANMFHDVTSSAFRSLSEPDRTAISRNNWFAPAASGRTAPPSRPRGPRGGDNRAVTRQGQP
jgi:hypothetical protein